MDMCDKVNSELFYNILNRVDDNNIDSQTCLISHEKLEYNYIVLKCGHTFNYEPLYREMLYQQTNKIQDNKNIRLNQIKCPYCRFITYNNLPYYKYYNLDKIMTQKNYNRYSILNSIDISSQNVEKIDTKKNTKINRCNYIIKSKKCNNIGCIENNDINICRCNKHNQYTKQEYDIINNLSTNKQYDILKKYKVNQLKHILKSNYISCIGNKETLIIKIIINNIKID